MSLMDSNFQHQSFFLIYFCSDDAATLPSRPPLQQTTLDVLRGLGLLEVTGSSPRFSFGQSNSEEAALVGGRNKQIAYLVSLVVSYYRWSKAFSSVLKLRLKVQAPYLSQQVHQVL